MWNRNELKVSSGETQPLLNDSTSTSTSTSSTAKMGAIAEQHDDKGDIPVPENSRRDSVLSSIDDVGIIPKGVLDPVYEAKARVLNRAVGASNSVLH